MVWRGAAARLSADLRVAATYARPTEPSIPLDLGYPDLAPPIKAAFSVPNPSSPASNSHDWAPAPIPALGISLSSSMPPVASSLPVPIQPISSSKSVCHQWWLSVSLPRISYSSSSLVEMEPILG